MKTNYKNYGVREWVTLGVGILIFLSQFLKYTFNSLQDPTVEKITLVVWILLITFPKTLNDIIRKVSGVNKNNNS